MSRKTSNIKTFIEEVERTHKGLGIPIFYGCLSILANKSVFYIAEKGKGKTTVIRSLKQFTSLPNTSFILGQVLANTIVPNGVMEKTLDGMTLTQLAELGEIRDTHLIWKVEDLSTFGEYDKENLLKICSKLITDHSYTRTSKGLKISIENCKLTMFIAIQPSLFSSLIASNMTYYSMSSDRFTKFLLLNPLRPKGVAKRKLPRLKGFVGQGNIQGIKFKKGSLDLGKINDLFRQISEGRRPEYIEDYLKALCSFEGKSGVTQKEADLFYELFSPYLESFNLLLERETLGEPLKISSPELELLGEIASERKEITKDKLMKILSVKERAIEIPAKVLIEKGLVRKTEGEKDKPTVYFLGKGLEDFFKKYRSLNFSW